MFDSPGLEDFAIGLVNSVFNLPDGQVSFFWRNSNNRRTVKLILLVKKFLGLVEMTSGASKCWLQLARMASCENDFLCTLNNEGMFYLELLFIATLPQLHDSCVT